MEALDRQAEGLRVVLTSRSREYQEALGAGRLYGAAVVEVLPVEVAEAEAFLLAEQVGERHAAWKRVTRYVRAHPGSVAAATLTTPLALSLARDAYATSGDPSDLLDEQTYPTPEDLKRRLLTRFLTIAYPQPNERARALQVLTWIARHLGTNHDLAWWVIPSWWIPPWLRWLLNRLAFGFVGAIGGWVMGGPWGGVILGIAFGAAVRADGMSWYYRMAVFSTGVGVVVGLGTAAVYGIAAGAVAGLVAGAGFWGWAVRVWNTWGDPGPGANAITLYRAARRRTRVLSFGVGLGVGAVVGLIGTLRTRSVVEIVGGLAFGAGFGLRVGATRTVGLALFEVIWVHGQRRAPFMATLETAAARQVLRRAGAVYQFRHAALQDLLASDPLPEELTALGSR